MIKVKAPFGFTTIELDGKFIIYCCKISITTNDNVDIPNVGIHYKTTKTKKGTNVRRCTISYYTTSYDTSQKNKFEIMKYLRNHAQKKLDQKYAWVQEDLQHLVTL